jgi:hypothetical protein
MPELLIVDGHSHRIKHRLASTGLPLGIADNIDTREMLRYAPIAYDDKILLYSDGLVEARDAEDRQFGSERLLQAIADAAPNRIFEQIIDELDQHCGERAQTDDVTLVQIDCVHDVLPQVETPERIGPPVDIDGDSGEWRLSLRFDGARLRQSNPVPVLVNYLMELEDLQSERQSLFTVMTELYVNALDHGVLGLDSAMKNDPAGFETYFRTRESRLAALDSGYVRFDLSAQQFAARRSVLLRVEDSGPGFDFASEPGNGRDAALSGRGLTIVRDLCESLDFEGKGNIALARFSWKTAATG